MHNSDFQLAAALDNDCFHVCDLPLSKILLMNDSQYPWFIQVPRINNVSEIIELSDCQQSQLWYESKILSEAIGELFNPDKLNMGALGNVVSQLHIHHIARYHSDVAWPKPVWGQAPAVPYQQDKQLSIITQMCSTLQEKLC
ncbi:HIT domain-containing protein [Aliiglaciecola litoralis]|uniref:HIT domain-containing protein n=1 Tax=Aliiglaciecola litoralis TaxID=582857 RepID=A0ABN1LND1_9ALTE